MASVSAKEELVMHQEILSTLKKRRDEIRKEEQKINMQISFTEKLVAEICRREGTKITSY